MPLQALNRSQKGRLHNGSIITSQNASAPSQGPRRTLRREANALEPQICDMKRYFLARILQKLPDLVQVRLNESDA